MKNRTKVKVILLIFFIIFASFLFWFFYQPSVNEKTGKTESNWSKINFFGWDEKPSTTNKNDGKNNQNQNQQTHNFKKEEIPKLRQISKIPTAGVVIQPLSVKEIHRINVSKNIYNTNNAWDISDGISEIRYVSKKNGYVYSTFTNTLKDRKITNTVMLKVYNADFWDKNNLIMQYLDGDWPSGKIQTYSVQLREKSEEEEIIEKIFSNNKKISINQNLLKFNGFFLPVGIEDYSLLEKTKQIFYLLKKDKNTIGVISEFNGSNKVQVFESPLKEWNIKWKNQNNILLNLKPSFITYSLFFELNPNTGKNTKIMKASLAGNGVPNYSFSKILYSAKDTGGEMKLNVYNKIDGSVRDLNIKTFVDKCVWSKNNINVYCAVPDDNISVYEPDLWYKGYTNFTDSVYKINTETGESELIVDPFEYDQDFDLVKLKLDNNEKYLYFIDSKTDFAWSFELPKEEYPVAIENYNVETHKILGGGKLCSSDKILTENLKSGDRNKKYSRWAKKKITEVKLLQEHMNRLDFSAGPVDGILGVKSDAAIKRMQKFLGTFQDGKVGPITRNLINHSCK